jgi:hypothetical protein
MLAVTHLVLALLLIKAFKLDRNEAFATLLFGVFIDLDHVLGMVDFIAKDGWGNVLNLDAAMNTGVQWKSLIHSPEGAILVVPTAVLFRWAIPAIAWGLHLVMDYVQMNYLGICSGPEMVLLAGLIISLFYLEWRNHLEMGRRLTVRELIDIEKERSFEAFAGFPLVGRISKWIVPRGISG